MYMTVIYHMYIYWLYDTGTIKQEVKHDKFTNIGGGDDFYGMCTTSGVLWAAARSKGLLQFTIK